MPNLDKEDKKIVADEQADPYAYDPDFHGDEWEEETPDEFKFAPTEADPNVPGKTRLA